MLDPEVLHFGGGHRESVTPRADWGRAAAGRSCLTPVDIARWAAVFVERDKGTVRNFCKIVCQQGQHACRL